MGLTQPIALAIFWPPFGSDSFLPFAVSPRCYNLHNGRDGYNEVDIIPWTQCGKDWCLDLKISKWVDSHKLNGSMILIPKLILQTPKKTQMSSNVLHPLDRLGKSPSYNGDDQKYCRSTAILKVTSGPGIQGASFLIIYVGCIHRIF